MKISFPKKLYLIAQVKLWGILATMILVLVIDLKYGISNSSFTAKTFETLFFFFLGFLFFPAITKVFKKMKSVQNKLILASNSAKLGFEGEGVVAAWLNELLPIDNYLMASNVKIPGYNFDIDFVVAGPKGIILLEVKNYSNKVIFENNNYLINKSGQQSISHNDPREKVKHYEQKFRQYLEKNQLVGIKINSAIVFLRNDGASIIGKTGVFIIQGREALNKYFMSLYDDPKYTPEISKKIQELCK